MKDLEIIVPRADAIRDRMIGSRGAFAPNNISPTHLNPLSFNGFVMLTSTMTLYTNPSVVVNGIAFVQRCIFRAAMQSQGD